MYYRIDKILVYIEDQSSKNVPQNTSVVPENKLDAGVQRRTKF